MFAEVLHAIADGKTAQQKFHGSDRWFDMPEGGVFLSENGEFRVKPEKVYPVTRMKHADLIAAYGKCGYDKPVEPNSLCAQGFERIANAALRHAIDAGQVIVPTKD